MERSQVYRWYVLEKLPDTEISEANNIPVKQWEVFLLKYLKLYLRKKY